jgi:hypothetical protein
MWATQGLNLYVLTRLHWRPDWPVEKIMAEYYEAFGAAKNDVRRYFEYWETQTQRAAKELADLQREDAGAQLFGNWTNLHQAIGRLYTPENYATGARLLAAAHLAVADDATARQRIEFLQSGLEDARLVALASVANEEFKRTKDDEKLIAAIGVLDRARAQTAQRFPQAVNMDLAAWMENRDWNRAVYSAINSAAGGSTPVARLPLEWRLRWDENKIGEREAWFANGGDETLWQAVNVNAPWEKQAVGKAWRDAHGGVDYNGWAWYRVRFNVDAKWRNKKLTLLFGAVDEAATIYLNGRKIGTHPFINPNDWQTPFIVEASEAIKFDGENELVVLVEDSAGAGGVWKPVWLIAP